MYNPWSEIFKLLSLNRVRSDSSPGRLTAFGSAGKEESQNTPWNRNLDKILLMTYQRRP